eukprot:CAMPEP_0171458728 /NCGR_PEP_ID=MMETSP0945-20130129/4293_1 /TAXON_ID=109269 /ORGANISM="Vaucheria litorea, Strain CCMP2940" /LENGTH=502 /DNA_ID=CAMNT_0011984599 /DNA_START=10 /DNA_END=1515 /DNA_ORIENTATION=-
MTAETFESDANKRPKLAIDPKSAPHFEKDRKSATNPKENGSSVIIQFRTMDGESKGPKIDIPIESKVEQLEQVLNKLLSNEENVPFSFFVEETEITDSLTTTLDELKLSTEAVLEINYQPLAIFKVRPVTRCTSTLPGHTDAVLHVSYSPDGKQLASGGGDATVRFWDIHTCTPKYTCKGHKHHVLCTAWSPDGQKFASGDKNGTIIIWNPKNGEIIGNPLNGHKKWITSLSWEPMHKNSNCERLASSSKDCLSKIWNVRSGKCVVSLSGHSDSVECVKWGGEGLLYSCSRDRKILAWNVDEGTKFGTLFESYLGHGHRINTLALNTEYVLRTGPFGYKTSHVESPEDAKAKALERYNEMKGSGPEILISGSDDFTLFMWKPKRSKKPIARLTGHQQPVNHIAFSPNGHRLASASFDKKVKVWDGKSGKFLATLTGHVGAVYSVAWSADSRMLVSASKDSTVKLWEMVNLKKATVTLPGHEDEVYALDWSPNGEQLASGSKD